MSYEAKDAHGGGSDGGARERPCLELQVCLGGEYGAVRVHAYLDGDVGSRGRPRGLEYLLAGHHRLDWAAGLLGQDGDGRIEVGGNLATESTSDFHGDDLYPRFWHIEDLGYFVARAKRPLSAAPDGDAPIGVPQSSGYLGLDVSLVDGRSIELALDDEVCIGEALLYVALDLSEVLRDVGGTIAHFSHFIRAEGFV